MNKKKTIIGLCLIAFLFGASYVFASTFSTEAEKWFTANCTTDSKTPKSLSAAVCDLRERILALEATDPVPGPKGDKGDTGDQGPVGPQGEPGESGSLRHIFDANNQDLGELISIESSNNQVVTFLPDKGYLTLKPIFQGFEITSNYSAPEILYTGPNCTGDSFMVNNAPLPQTIIRIPGNPVTYWAFKPGTRMDRSPISRRYTNANTCANDTFGTLDTFLFEQVTLPFTEPIAWPLEIR